MPSLSIRNLPEPTVAALKARAQALSAQGARVSVEALVRNILVDATRPVEGGLGTKFHAIGQRIGGFDLDLQRPVGAIEAASFD